MDRFAHSPIEGPDEVDDWSPRPLEELGRSPEPAPVHAETAARFPVSLPGALAAALLVSVAFGGVLGPWSPTRSSERPDGAVPSVPPAVPGGHPEALGHAIDAKLPEDGATKAIPTVAPPVEKATEPTARATLKPTGQPVASKVPASEPTKAPTPKPTVKPSPKPTAELTPAPVTATLGIEVTMTNGQVLVSWTACKAIGHESYKVVRSKDATVAWPLGDKDSLLAVVDAAGETAAYDKGLPAGVTVWYRVFCVASSAAGSAVLQSSDAKPITVPVEPKPEPGILAFDAVQSPSGVQLGWSASTGDGFAYYKVLRAATTPKPSYLPWTDGTEVIAVIADPWVTGFTDTSPSSGTWYYRVQAIGTWSGQKIVLAATPVRELVLE